MLEDFAIHKINVIGASPGWIYGHRAVLSDDGKSIMVLGGMIDPGSTETSLKENVEDWVLDLSGSIWTRSTDRNWQQWVFHRTDRKHSQLWNLRQAIWARGVQWKEHLAREMERLESKIGRTPDLDLIPSLYCPDDSFTQLPQDEDRHNVFRVLVDGTIVRFTEEFRLVRASVEGRLSRDRLQALQESVRNKLSTLHGVTWEIETLD